MSFRTADNITKAEIESTNTIKIHLDNFSYTILDILKKNDEMAELKVIKTSKLIKLMEIAEEENEKLDIPLNMIETRTIKLNDPIDADSQICFHKNMDNLGKRYQEIFEILKRDAQNRK